MMRRLPRRMPWDARPSFWDSLSKITSLVFGDLYDAAWRENRQRDRAERRYWRNLNHQMRGLNGQRAMDRRRRQIAEGRLTAANGLVGGA